MDVAGHPPPPDPVFVLANLRRGALGSRSAAVNDEEGYVDAFVVASLQMLTKGLPYEFHYHGEKMVQHLLDFRMDKLSSKDHANLTRSLVGLPVLIGLRERPNSRKGKLRSTDCANLRRSRDTAILRKEILSRMDHASFRRSRLGPLDVKAIQPMSYEEDSCHMPNSINACKIFIEFVDTKMPVSGDMMSHSQGEGSLLLLEHNIICQALLIVISNPRTDEYTEIAPQLAPCLFNLLNRIWTLPEWRRNYLHHGPGLTCLFSDRHFLKMVYYLIKIVEDTLNSSRPQYLFACLSRESYIVLLRFILPLIFELLQCIHALWYPPVAFNISEELERVKYPDTSVPFASAIELFYISGKEAFEKETRSLLEGTLESGYNVIGLCVGGPLCVALNYFCASVALSKYLGSLEFRHLIKLIKLTIIPSVTNWPCLISWKHWADNLLQPLVGHCAKILHYAWSRLLYHKRAGALYYFGKLSGSEEEVKTLERGILLEFTRQVSDLLEALAMREQNEAHSLEDVPCNSLPSSSLFRYLVFNDFFGRLRMSLFGYFVDDKATVKAVPFCRALVRLAVACNDSRLRIFILDDLLPCLIQRLDNRLPCAIQSLISELNSSTNINATRNNLSSNEGDNACTSLCQELYGYMLKNNYLQTQSSAGHSKISDDDENSFKVWLKMQMEDFQTKASISKKLPNGDPWIWEFEDECQRYISIYIDMVQEVDAIDDFAERIYLDKKKLFEKLRPEFRSKYAINSYEHPYMATISSMQKRKFYSMDDVMENRKICSLVRDLIRLKKPYIKGSDSSWNVIYRAKRTVGKSAELSKYVPRSVQLLHSILLFWEPRFHPMIREALMDKLLNVVGELTTSGYLKPLLRIIEDFPPHLQPYLETKLKESNYYIAEEQIQLHEEFDEYLASGDFDEFMDRFAYYKDDFLEYVVENKLLPSPFWALEKSLVKLSFERRAEIVSLDTEIRTYAKCVEGLLESEPLTLHVKSLISELEAEGFFDVDSNQDWEKISFAEQIAKFSSYLFPENSLPTHYAIRGLIDCRKILLEKNVNLQVAFKKVVLDVCDDLTGYLLKFWNDTRYYEHQFYAIIRDPLKQVISGASI